MYVEKQGIFLVGPMGAGKTTVGKALSDCFKIQFLDTDLMLTNKFKLNVKQIFSIFGEQDFRGEEAKLIDEVTRMPKVVIATGGGSIEDPNTREILAARGVVMYLKVSPIIQKKRLINAYDRPLLSKIDQMQHREELYSTIADKEIDTDYLTVSEIVEDVYNFCCKRA